MSLTSTVGRVSSTVWRTSIGEFEWNPDPKVFDTHSTSLSSEEKAKREAAEDFGRNIVKPHGEWLGAKLGVIHSLFNTNPVAAREYLRRLDQAFKEFDGNVADLVSSTGAPCKK